MLNVTQLRNHIEAALISRDTWKYAREEQRKAFEECLIREDLPQHPDVDIRIYWKWFDNGWRARSQTIIREMSAIHRSNKDGQ